MGAGPVDTAAGVREAAGWWWERAIFMQWTRARWWAASLRIPTALPDRRGDCEPPLRADVWPWRNPIGRRSCIIEDGAPQAWLTVVGVVPDIGKNDLCYEFQPLIYLPYRQKPLPDMSVVACTMVPPGTLAPRSGAKFRRRMQPAGGCLTHA